jgi:hypothetical protein
MVINSGFVTWEIFIDGESSLNWTMGHNFSLNLRNLRWNAVDGLCMPFIVGICVSGILTNAFSLASWSRLRFSTWLVFTSSVMVTGSESVRHAIVG